jgi:hypothetical protein
MIISLLKGGRRRGGFVGVIAAGKFLKQQKILTVKMVLDVVIIVWARESQPQRKNTTIMKFKKIM